MEMYKWMFFVLLLGGGVCSVQQECCPLGMNLMERSKMCSDNQTRIGLVCTNGALLLDPSENEFDEFSLTPNGKLKLIDGVELYPDEFCLGKIQRNGSEISVALMCFEKQLPQSDIISLIPRIFMFISIFFLLVTLYLYSILPNLRDFQGKCVIALICCLIASYMTLLIIHTFPDSSRTLCIIQAASLYFFLCSTFFWNNIITFNIWKAIRNVSQKITKQKATLYVIWGFGIPLTMTVVSLILDFIPSGNHIRPTFGETGCWFKGKIETWSYFYGPISVLLILNTLMFLQSIWTLWRSYRASNVAKLRSLRYKCLIYLKLFLLMGITWIFEVISYAAGSHKHSDYIWFIPDCLNAAQGILIFFILVVCRQKVKIGILKKKLFNINWPQRWATEEMQESLTASIVDELELAQQKTIMINESHK